MRKLYLFMLMFCGLFLCGQAAQAQTSYVLSNETYDESTSTTASYNFTNGFSISNEKSKKYGYVKEINNIKFSANVTYTIHIPDGVKIAKVTFSGYDNYDSDAWIKDINGKSFEATDYMFPAKADDGTTTDKSFTFDFSDSPVSGTLPFTLGNKQCCLIITLETPAATNIQNATVASKDTKAQKYLDRGKVVIEKAGKKFNAAGQQLK